MSKTKKPSSAELAEQIRGALSFGKGDKVNLAYAIYKLLTQAEKSDRPELIQMTCELFEDTSSSEELALDSFMTGAEAKVLANRYGNLVDQMLGVLVQENLDEAGFYAGLWDIVTNPMFRDEKTQAFALYYMLIDKHIPYFKLEDGLRMSNDEFGQRVSALTSERSKLRFILAREFDQRTERADLVLKLLESVDRSDQVVLMADLLKSRKKSGDLTSSLLEALVS